MSGAVQKWNMTPLAEERAQRKRERKAEEEAAKATAKRLDSYACRWPHKCLTATLDGAHLDGKGMGGNKNGSRNVPENIITLCREAHQGVRSLHSGHKRIVPLTERGTRGPCEFWDTDPNDREYLVGRETAVHVLERD